MSRISQSVSHVMFCFGPHLHAAEATSGGARRGQTTTEDQECSSSPPLPIATHNGATGPSILLARPYTCAMSNKYKKVKPIGSGSFGKVFLGKDTGGDAVVIKDVELRGLM